MIVGIRDEREVEKQNHEPEGRVLTSSTGKICCGQGDEGLCFRHLRLIKVGKTTKLIQKQNPPVEVESTPVSFQCTRAQPCATLCKSVDCSPAGSSVHRIFQVRILEWVAIYSSRDPSRPRD